MLNLPHEFVIRMKSQLGAEADAFFDALEKPSPTTIRLHHLKSRSSFELAERVPWCDTGWYLASRPFFHMDPHWHGGTYYVQEASSMILDYVLSQIPSVEKPRIWLDVCAAPGGKTGILAKHLKPEDVLIANEVVSQRRAILKENLVKAGFLNTFIAGYPSSAFTEPLADIMLIDAPCAGEGMMRKEPEAIHQWNPALVQSCALMQKQIVQDATGCLKPEGYLIYSTCSYSMEENIQNVKHFIQKHDVHPVALSFPEKWNITTIKEDEAIGYQLYPHKVKGEGLFIALLKKGPEEQMLFNRMKKTRSEFAGLSGRPADHMENPSLFLVRNNSIQNELISLLAEEAANEVIRRLPRVELIVSAGELKGKDFVPSHALAMSGLQQKGFGVIDLDLSSALDYLERKTSGLPVSYSPGWYIIRYEDTNLGWAKMTGQGWKNHYPMNWRLRDRRLK
jgi:16S rRNA C967 or C1407 C5-methylase (RsmB/RsmF family)/NOL1/NOP2/fmu family ribosome biogenesis protein